MVGVGSQVGVFGGGQDRAMAEDLLYLEQIDTRFDQMGCIAVAQAVRGNLFWLLLDSRLFSKKESKQGIQESFTSLSCIVHELEESKIVGQ